MVMREIISSTTSYATTSYATTAATAAASTAKPPTTRSAPSNIVTTSVGRSLRNE